MTTQVASPVTATVHTGPHELVPDGTLRLVLDLCQELWASGVRYCQWKNTHGLVRSLRGESDLDLLIHRRDAQRFIRALTRLGFRPAIAPGGREQPGVGHYYALDDGSGRLLHVHAHFALLLGGDTTKNFRLPIERAYLGSTRYEHVLPTPSPEFELAVWVIRMMLKHATWDAWIVGNAGLTPDERRELSWLLSNADLSLTRVIVTEHFPGIEAELWTRCLRNLAEGSAAPGRLKLGLAVSHRLRPHARRGWPVDLTLRVVRRGLRGGRRRLVRKPVRKRLGQAGAIVAIVGGDERSRADAVSMVIDWLDGTLLVKPAHLDEPPPSLMTLLLKGPMVLRRLVGLPWGRVGALGHLTIARDRLREYRALRSFADRGGIVVSDQWALAADHSVRARTSSMLDHEGVGRLTRRIASRERAIYRRMGMPDIVVVLPPATAGSAVEQLGLATPLRTRPADGEDMAWQASGAVVLEARATQESVASAVRAAVWASL